MVTKKTTAVAFIGILIAAGLVAFVTQVQSQTLDQQKEALIGEWRGLWATHQRGFCTLIIHEIDIAKGKARCTYTDAYLSDKKYPLLADLTPGPEPRLAFKVEGNEYNFVLKKVYCRGPSKVFVMV